MPWLELVATILLSCGFALFVFRLRRFAQLQSRIAHHGLFRDQLDEWGLDAAECTSRFAVRLFAAIAWFGFIVNVTALALIFAPIFHTGAVANGIYVGA